MKKSEIVKYLDKKNVRHSLSGFDYLITAINMCTEDTDRIHSVCKLYADVAKVHGTTKSRVERAIRNAIETAGEEITNSEFIARARDYLIYE